MKLIKIILKIVIYTPIVIVVSIKSIIEILILDIKEMLGIKTEVENLAEEQGVLQEKYRRNWEKKIIKKRTRRI